MDLYHKKYLKYKAKYQLLKKQYGGNKRIENDLRRLEIEPIDGISIQPSENLFVQTAIINGPEGTPYEGYRWRIKLEFPHLYPFKSPTVQFIDRIFHPNFDYVTGKTKIYDKWNPKTTIGEALIYIRSLLNNPCEIAVIAVNREARNLYNDNRVEYNRRVREESARMKASQPELEVPQ
jgi:ubiquitin-protein ligase